MKEANRVFKNTTILYFKMFITVVPSLYSTRLILEGLGVNDFGILSLLMGVLSMLNFFNAALSSSSLRFMSYAKGKDDFEEELSVFNIAILLHFSLAVLLVFAFTILSTYFVNDVLTIDSNRLDVAQTIFYCLIIGMFFSVISVPYDALINAHEDMYIIAIIGIFQAFLTLGAALYIVSYEGDRLELYGYIMAIISGTVFLGKFTFGHYKYLEAKINVYRYFDRKIFTNMLSFSSYNLLGISFQMIAFYGQGVILNMFFGTVVNAAQALVNQMSGQLTSFANTMQKALNPMIIKSEGAGNRKLMLEASFAGNKISFFMLMFFYIPFFLEIDTILDLWLVEIPEFTIIFATLYFIRNLIDQLYQTLGPAIFSVGNIRNFQIYNSILSVIPLPFAYILFKSGFPAFSIYIVFILYSFIQGAIYIYFAKVECSMSISKYFRDVVIKSLIPFILTFFVVMVPHILIENSIYRLITVVCINIFAFSLSVWIFGLSEGEKLYTLQLLDKLKGIKKIFS